MPRRKASCEIVVEQAKDVLAALLHAEHADLLPNRHVTINWQAAGIKDPIAATGQLMKLMGDAARRQGGAIAYVWVREVGEVHGEHVHILLHLSRGLPNTWYARRMPSWLKRCGAVRAKGNSCTRVIRGCRITAHSEVTSPDLFKANLRNVTAYVLKHCSAEVQSSMGVISRGPALLKGKRVSISQNLHRTAQKACDRCTSDDMA